VVSAKWFTIATGLIRFNTGKPTKLFVVNRSPKTMRIVFRETKKICSKKKEEDI